MQIHFREILLCRCDKCKDGRLIVVRRVYLNFNAYLYLKLFTRLNIENLVTFEVTFCKF
jgi:hypothetical protein